MTEREADVLRVDFKQPRDPSAPDLGLLRRRTGRKAPACDHPQVEIDARTHDVTCRACEAPVAPTVILIRLARQEMSLLWTREEEVAVRRRVEALLADEKLIKARIRRARDRARGLEAL